MSSLSPLVPLATLLLAIKILMVSGQAWGLLPGAAGEGLPKTSKMGSEDSRTNAYLWPACVYQAILRCGPGGQD